MSQSNNLGREICQFFTDERAASKAILRKPEVLDTPCPADPVKAAQWEREQDAAGTMYCEQILKKTNPTPAEIAYVAKQARLAIELLSL
jgi:hypothetical protein